MIDGGRYRVRIPVAFIHVLTCKAYHYSEIGRRRKGMSSGLFIVKMFGVIELAIAALDA